MVSPAPFSEYPNQTLAYFHVDVGFCVQLIPFKSPWFELECWAVLPCITADIGIGSWSEIDTWIWGLFDLGDILQLLFCLPALVFDDGEDIAVHQAVVANDTVPVLLCHLGRITESVRT